LIPVLLAWALLAGDYVDVPPPKMERRADLASATSVPWIDSNGWRFLRGVKKARYAKLPPGSAALAAAEAHAYGVEAVFEPAESDKESLAAMQAFIRRIDAPRLPVRANIGVIDDGSPEIEEVLNLLGRRNLLYKVISKPDPSLDVNVRLGTKQFPRDAAADPNGFAARVREQLGDDKRLVRLFGSYTVLAHLTGEQGRARLYLLNYSPRPVRDLRVRVAGEFAGITLAEAVDPAQTAKDIIMSEGGTELTVSNLRTYAVVDLVAKKE
jgi:hypothetical protein